MFLITTTLLIILICLSLLIIGYSFSLILTNKFLSIQFNWLIVSCFYSIALCLLFLFYNRFHMIGMIRFEVLNIYLFLSSFLYMSLFFSKFHKLFFDIYHKKFYFFFTIISIFVILFFLIILLTFIPDSKEVFHLATSYGLLYTFSNPLFLLLIIFPMINIITFLAAIVKNGNILRCSLRLLYAVFVVYFFIGISLILAPSFMLDFLFLLQVFLKIFIYSILIKNIVFDKGRYEYLDKGKM